MDKQFGQFDLGVEEEEKAPAMDWMNDEDQ